ncbi:MAG: leucine/isoleucine/valine transporter permease subunit [Anaerolineae bacterium]|nr:leucine/isoleucine/valine transporter permease subunit [Anaerolineae bacterium]
MRSAWRQTFRLGLIGGIATWHFCLVGMVETFAERQLVGEVLSLGYVLLLFVMFMVGILAARTEPSGRSYLLRGVVAGGTVGLILTLLVIFIQLLNPRSIFIHASPRLVQLLTLGLANPWGLGVPIIAGALAGLAGGALDAIPAILRRSVIAAVAITLFMGLLRDVIAVLLPSGVAGFLFTATGLQPIGALLILTTVGVAFGAWNAVHARRFSPPPLSAPAIRRGGLTLGVLVLLTFPLWARIFLSNVADFVGLYIIMGLGLNLVVGFAGLLDLGYVAFFAIGAYTMAVLTSPEIGLANLTFWEALPISIFVALLSGILLGLPVLRMRGDYLAITTLGFGEIIRILVLSDALKPYLGAAQGITRIARPVIGPLVFDTPEEFYYLILAGVLLAWVVAARLKTSRIGRAWMAIREDEDVAQAMGINRVTAKLLAFAIGASLGGLSGALFASMVGSVVPKSFELLISINVLALIIIGGMGSLPGVIVGALALVGLPELLREFREYRLLIYGAVLVGMMLYRPEGLWPERMILQELREEKERVKSTAAPTRERKIVMMPADPPAEG